ncbi:MAG: hypothetical protein JSS02_15685 [Planctomycetes bacterium]|nr:hypothetical protein [Planctomycetota bacterium]
MAGFQTQREEGVECCYSKQTKFWVHDPDGGLWEFYILEGDIAHRGAGQSSDALLPQVGNCGPACGQPAVRNTQAYEHRMGENLALAGHADESLSEVRLRGTFNVAGPGVQLADTLAEAWRALQPGGKLQIHVLTSDQSIDDRELSLPGPASRVGHVPVDTELLQALEDARFANVSLTTFRPAPCFRLGTTELRETMIACLKPQADLCGQTRVLVYKGPFQQVTDDEGHTFRRGERVTVPLSAWENLQATPLASQFVCFDANSSQPAVCGTH